MVCTLQAGYGNKEVIMNTTVTTTIWMDEGNVQRRLS